MKRISLCFGLVFLLALVNGCKKDACDDVTCRNEGICINGTCDCAVGYTGPFCEDQITPQKVIITSIRVTKFLPTDDNGAGWDLSSGADIFVSIDYNGAEIYESDIFYENADPNFTYSFSPTQNLSFENPLDRYTIWIIDYDTLDPNDYIGGIEFSPYSANNGFPEMLMLDAGGGVGFEIDVLYSF